MSVYEKLMKKLNEYIRNSSFLYILIIRYKNITSIKDNHKFSNINSILCRLECLNSLKYLGGLLNILKIICTLKL